MTSLSALSGTALADLLDRTRAEYDAFKARGLKLDMTRGKPAPDQLGLAEGMLALPGNRDHTSAAGEDARNYGNLQGLAETRALFSTMAGAPPAQIVIGNNASLAMMHDTIAWALLKGVPGGSKPWSQEPVSFLCPVPGYDRHFTICEEYGIRMIPVRMTGEGPDMDAVEAAVAADPSIRGMWCVPQYSNPTGEIYSEEVVRRLAAMPAAAPDFRLFWDNAYAVHHLSETKHKVANILDACAAAGHPDRAFVYASTSKISLAGAGVALFASSPANVAWYLARAGARTIGPDKLNQLRHVRFFGDHAGIEAHMEKHRALLAPKFEAVLTALEERLAPHGVAQWVRPEGGYFISVAAAPGTARQVVRLAKEAGLALTPAGATWPYRDDPDDSALRLAPSFPTLADVKVAAEGIALCVLLAAVEQEADRRRGTAD